MIKILEYGKTPSEELFLRTDLSSQVGETVSEIIKNVRENGDKALYEYCLRFDGAKLDSLVVTKDEIDEAFARADKELVRVLERAARNIREFHEKQKRNGFIIARENGTVSGQRVIPLDSAGLYVPGGTAAYPSTVLMDALPAKIAGVGRLCVTTPPDKNGKVGDAILIAARIAGVDTIYKTGGAQAIAALAYGTETIKKVDKIVGPGNAFVAEAKRRVSGVVGIDMIAGPSEILVVSDGKSSPRVIAADMLSQAEHDKNATAVLLTDDRAFAEKVSEELEKQIPLLPRREIARASIDNNGKIIVAPTLDLAIDLANELAPEHLELCVDEPFAYLGKLRHAGSVFMGRSCPEALGDYLSGANHTLPTGGTAKFSSPLSVDDFVKKMQYTYYTSDSLGEVYKDIALFARTEGLEAHARSAEVRFEEEQ